jgi:voltage-dependent calcium channel
MAQIPHFTVPEIFVDDEDDDTSAKRRTGIHDPPVLSPHSIDMTSPRASHRTSGSSSGFNPRGVSPIDTNVRNRRDSRTTSPTHSEFSNVNVSPQLSPHRLSTFSYMERDTSYYGSGRSASPTSPGADRAGTSSPTAGRRGSAAEGGSSVSTQGMMESLDNSAWGESIRRSFTMRRSTRHGRATSRSGRS